MKSLLESKLKSLHMFVVGVLSVMLGSFSGVYASGTELNFEHSVYRLLAKKNKGVASGTAFLISTSGFLITNQHVIQGATRIAVVKGGGVGKPSLVDVEVVWKSQELDLAVIKTQGLSGKPLLLSLSEAKKGQSVFTVGFPGAADRTIDGNTSSITESTITQGIIGRVITAAWEEGKQKIQIVQHSASVNSGNSGGPLLNQCGEVIGVNTAKAVGVVEGSYAGKGIVNQADGIYYASHISVITRALRENNIAFSESTKDCQVATAANISQAWGNLNTGIFVVLVIVVGLSIVSLYVALRRPSKAIESYTNFLRRKSIDLSGASIPQVASRLLITGDPQKLTPNSLEINLRKHGTTYLLGRDISGDGLMIGDLSVSRRHAKLVVMPDGLLIEDLNSTNGTRVNGIPLNGGSRLIRAGDSITLGTVALDVRGT